MRSVGDYHSATRYKKGQWTPEEDVLLMKYIETHGEGKWRTLPQKAGLQRCGKGCRLRWKNYLRPNVKRGNISLEEEDLIIRLHKLVGNRWSLIAGRLPGRTDNEIKNYWNSHLSKKLRCDVTIESSSHNKGSSSPSDHFNSSENVIVSGILHMFNHRSLLDCRMDCVDDQQREYYQSSHMTCAFHRSPHFEVENVSTRFSQYLPANYDVGLSTGAWLQQPLPPSNHLCERNGQVFHSMVAMQPMNCSSSSLCFAECYDEIWANNDLGFDGCYDEIWTHNDLGSNHYDEMWDYSDLGCTETQDPSKLASDYESLSKIFEDSITNDFDADVQSMNSILGRAKIYDNLNAVEANPCHDLHTIQVTHPIISLLEHSEECTNGFYVEDNVDAFSQQK